MKKIKIITKKILKKIMPPFTIDVYNLLLHRNNNGFSGDYTTYDEAINNSSGYETEVIINKKTITQKERLGNYGREIDGLTMFLLSAFSITGLHDNVKVLDWGGELGFHNLMFSKFLPKICFDWTVWETPAMCERGQSEFANKYLRFTTNPTKNYDVLIASGTMQCVDDPQKYWELILAIKPKFIIFNRFPFITEYNDRLTIQYVPSSVYEASYPAWFFSREKWMQIFNQKYEIIAEWDDVFDSANIPSSKYVGFILKSK